MDHYWSGSWDRWGQDDSRKKKKKRNKKKKGRKIPDKWILSGKVSDIVFERNFLGLNTVKLWVYNAHQSFYWDIGSSGPLCCLKNIW